MEEGLKGVPERLKVVQPGVDRRRFVARDVGVYRGET
jgi:hypothetical protein